MGWRVLVTYSRCVEAAWCMYVERGGVEGGVGKGGYMMERCMRRRFCGLRR